MWDYWSDNGRVWKSKMHKMTNKGLQKRIAMIFFKLSVIPKENASMYLCKKFWCWPFRRQPFTSLFANHDCQCNSLDCFALERQSQDVLSKEKKNGNIKEKVWHPDYGWVSTASRHHHHYGNNPSRYDSYTVFKYFACYHTGCDWCQRNDDFLNFSRIK